MSAPFPFGLPASTAWYLVLYVVTLAAHVVFMNYVLAGSGLLAWDALRRALGRRGRGDGAAALQPSAGAEIVRDWLPFSIGAAITAGVAPLLFVQILYQESFYTANLLLFLRWLALLPILVAGFYLAYLMKTEWLSKRGDKLRALVAVGALGCFALTGYSWAENHLLSLDRAAWTQFYASGAIVYWSPALLPRVAMWFLGAIPTLAMLLGWQLRNRKRKDAASVDGGAERRLAVLGGAGVVLAAAGAALHYAVVDEPWRTHFTGAFAAPYLYAAIGGLVIQAAAWVWQWRRGSLSRGGLSLATAGCLVTIVGMSVVREALRLGQSDLPKLFARHREVATTGGLVVFLVFFVANAGLIGWAVRAVRKETRGASPPPSTA